MYLHGGVYDASSPPTWDVVEEILENRIGNILALSGHSEEGEAPLFSFSSRINFRSRIAFTAPYNAGSGNKPYHYDNIKAFLKGTRDCIEIEGFEADDLIGILLTKSPEKYVCCTRDKDLRQIPGWHFGWELGNQPQFGPFLVEGFGHIELDAKKKIRGWGEKFFYAQLLMGDRVDTIPGIEGMGDVGAFKIISPCQDSNEALKACIEAYKASYGLYWCDVIVEQCRLS